MTNRTTLLSGIVGSTAYGLAGPGSDVDRLGVFAESTMELVGLHAPEDTFCRYGPDSTLHEARKYCTLALGGNPTVTELMWLPDELYEVRTDLGSELIGLRSAFLSAKRVRDAYFGYATSQLSRLLTTGSFQSKQRARSEKHARHLLRLLDQGFALYSTGHLPIRLEDPARYMEFGQRVAEELATMASTTTYLDSAHRINVTAQAALTEAEAKFDSIVSPLPDRPDMDAVEEWLRKVRRTFW